MGLKGVVLEVLEARVWRAYVFHGLSLPSSKLPPV